jgi:hypothetical protein
MKTGVAMIAVGIVTTVIRFVPGLEHSSMLEPAAFEPSAPIAAATTAPLDDPALTVPVMAPKTASCSKTTNNRKRSLRHNSDSLNGSRCRSHATAER